MSATANQRRQQAGVDAEQKSVLFPGQHNDRKYPSVKLPAFIGRIKTGEACECEYAEQ
jgi:hypothetical protein